MKNHLTPNYLLEEHFNQWRVCVCLTSLGMIIKKSSPPKAIFNKDLQGRSPGHLFFLSLTV